MSHTSRNKSRSSRAGIVFPIGRVHRMLREGHFAKRIGADAPVFLAAALEYLVAEVVDQGGHVAQVNKKQRITPRFIQLTARNDYELAELLSHVHIADGGVVSEIHPALLPKAREGTLPMPNLNTHGGRH